MIFFIIYKLHTWSRDLNSNFAWKDCLFAGVKLAKNVDIDKRVYSGYGTNLINLHPNEYSQKLCYYSFVVNLDRCAGSCNTLDDFSNKVCVTNETEGLTLHVFNMITGINESRTLTKHIPFKCEFKFDGGKCNLNQKWNNSTCRCESVKIQKKICVKEVIFGNLQHEAAKMGNMQEVLVIQ